MELSPLFSDDSRVAEAASIAQKLRKMALVTHKVIFIIFMRQPSLNLTAFRDRIRYHSVVTRISCEPHFS
jgi:hypothetical protein